MKNIYSHFLPILFSVETNVQTIVVAINTKKYGFDMEDTIRDYLIAHTVFGFEEEVYLSLLHHSLKWNIPSIFSLLNCFENWM